MEKEPLLSYLVVNQQSQDVKKMVVDVDVDGSEGLTSEKALELLAKVGPNTVDAKKIPLWRQLMPFFWGPMPWMIEAATIISGVLQDWYGFFTMFALLVLNGLIGIVETRNANAAMDAIKSQLAPKAKAKRDRKWTVIEARDLVPGDLIQLSIGDIVPSDCIVKEGKSIEIDQSSLTGESLPVEKTLLQEMYAGSVVKKGELVAVVSATGRNTFFGKAASLVADASTQEGHFQKILHHIATVLMVVALIFVCLCAGAILFKEGKDVDVGELIKLSLILLVASIPIATQPVCTATMAVGSRKLAKAGAIISRLSAIEELAGVNILCSDKTGTLTKNELTLDNNSYIGEGYTEQDLLLYAALACSSSGLDAIEKCIVNKALADKKLPNILQTYEKIDFQPFDPVSKRTQAIVQGEDGKIFKVMKGLPQVLLGVGKFEQEDIAETVEATCAHFASRGLRTLGVVKQVDEVFEYVGILAMLDPPRDDTKDTIRRAQEMGIEIKMVTGDHLLIAQETSRRLDCSDNILGADVLSMTEMEEDAPPKVNKDCICIPMKSNEVLEPSALAKMIEGASGFAQVFPEHKHLIVKVLQERKHIVAMTGDGVNDAAALKKADVGIAVHGASDAAKASADIILTTPGLSTIVTAIIRSRKIFQRMKNYIMYRINATISILGFSVIGIIVLDFYIPPIVLVLITILNDGTIMAIAYDNVTPSSKPSKWNLIEVAAVSIIVGAIGAAEVITTFWLANHGYLFSHKLSIAEMKTLCYLSLSVGGQLSVYACRTTDFFFCRRPGFLLLGASVFSIAASVCLALFWPLEESLVAINVYDTVIELALCTFFFSAKDVAKWGVYRFLPL